MFVTDTPSVSQAVMLAAAVIGLLLVGASTLRRRRNSRFRGSGSRRSEAATVQNVEEVMARLDDLARRIHARLDMKLATLEHLIRDADERIDKLTRSFGDDRSQLDVTLASEDPHVEKALDAPRALDPVQTSVYRLADSGLESLRIAQEVGRTPGEVDLMLALRRTRQAAAKTAAL